MAAAAAGADETEFGKLVEHVLLGEGGFNAVGRADWANQQLSGQAAWGRASQTQRDAATVEAARIRALTLAGSGCT